MTKINKGLQTMKTAVMVRTNITKMYSKYNIAANQVKLELGISRHDFKRAVDAIYYVGGWPHPNSKGRLESFLDNFANVLKILEFAGKAKFLHEHLATHGITVKLKAADRLKDGKLKYKVPDIFVEPTGKKDLLDQALSVCLELQSEICSSADHIKLELRPSALVDLEIEDKEYDRLFGAMRIKAVGEAGSKKITNKKDKVVNSLKNFEVAAEKAAEDKLIGAEK